MDKTTVSKMIFGAVLLLFTACTQDELAEQGNTLPDGKYPLQIGSVSITAESSEEPWTRVAEKPDGSGSVFQDGDRIGVRIGDNEETGVYIIKVDDAGNVTVEPDKPVYWKNTQTADVTAWYPADRSSVDLGFQPQNNTMTYVLHGTGTGNHQSPVTLKFTHQLAKVRVVAKGTAEVRNISIQHVPRICYIDEGIITGQETLLNDIWMLPVEREGIGTCWEASVGPDAEIKYFSLDGMDCDLTSSVTTQAGALHTITITANSEGTQTIDLSTLTDTHEINDNGTYYVTGTGSYGIKVTNGNPNIYLEDAQISVSDGNAIDIQGGSPTIHVRGENSVSSADNTGIAVSGGATLTIEGRSTADMLTATAGNGGAGIGSPLGGTVGGNITIGNVTIHATGGSGNSAFGGAGIGSSGSGNCGDVTIADAVIVANGGDYSSGIGMGYGNTSQPSIGKITITNSDVTAKAGRYASAIGFSYTESVVNPTPDYRAGQIIITTDNLETCLSKLTAGGTAHAEFAAYAQRIGVGSHAIPYPPSLLNQDGSGPWEGVVINGTVYADGYE